MEKVFYFKNLPISPKKLRLLLFGLKNIKPVLSLEYLEYLPKKGAKILKKAIKSAIDTTKSSLKIDENELKFRTLAVDGGRKLKRYRPGARGTVKPIFRRFSHLKIILMTKKNDLEQKVEKKLKKIKK
mgnify:CR=1 FL=1